jgi:catechol-2,3-dioxygenase
MGRKVPALRTLGHVVLNVRSHARSVPFYEQALGLRVVGHADAAVRARMGPMVFMSFGANHHDIALREIGGIVSRARRERPGLAHLAFRVGRSLEDLTRPIARLRAMGVQAVRTVDHGSICSAYFSDPDGLVLEAYVGDDRLPLQARPYRATARPVSLV